MPADSPRPRLVLGAAALDVTLVVVFAALGRREHERGGGIVGVLDTAWPFLVGLLLGWLLVRAWRAPTRPLHGLGVWLATLVGGLAIRALVLHWPPLSFALVAAGFLAACLVGWRLVAWWVSARASARDA
ncbi:DUF3054 domain-containing protein [Actinoalloteichus caeruleus]|uniref:DUF3054 domain-containing protein n=1 Tax=Actinoalloteichus cyanogriseus TaxID=2893586 RepID=UPI0004AB36DB|nr:DUF3054 domain-containing protein [Actinoalloteichus caeruleus]